MTNKDKMQNVGGTVIVAALSKNIMEKRMITK